MVLSETAWKQNAKVSNQINQRTAGINFYGMVWYSVVFWYGGVVQYSMYCMQIYLSMCTSVCVSCICMDICTHAFCVCVCAAACR